MLSRLPEDVLGAAACGGRRLNMDVCAFTVRRGLRTRIGHGSLLHVCVFEVSCISDVQISVDGCYVQVVYAY